MSRLCDLLTTAANTAVIKDSDNNEQRNLMDKHAAISRKPADNDSNNT